LRGILANVLKKNKKKLFIILVTLLIISASISVYSFSQPIITTNQNNENNSQIVTGYDYKATITPNILYPNGGTVEVGDTIFQKITTEIPFNLKSTIHSMNLVVAKGTHEVKLLIKAKDLWERTFPLEQKQEFTQEGTEISVIDNTYKLDLEEIQSFITQVEVETEIRSDLYTLEVIPNIQGKILFDGKEKTFQVQDKLTFQYSYGEIKRASEKSFTFSIPFTTSQTITNTFHLFGRKLPLSPVRTVSTLLSIFLLATIIYAYKKLVIHRDRPVTSQVERIHKKYRNRIISVSQKLNITQKSIFTLDSFQSIIKIADEKELPIFFYKDHQTNSGNYFLVDSDYLYNYETIKTDVVPATKKGAGSDNSYARG
jgi:hypothetical protein